MKYNLVIKTDTSFYGPLGQPIGPLVDLRLKFDIGCQFFLQLLQYVIKLDYSAESCIWSIEFPNGKRPTTVKLSFVILQSEVASVPRKIAFVLPYTSSWKENYCDSLLFKILISRHLGAYHNVLCCVQKIKLSLNSSYPTGQGVKPWESLGIGTIVKISCKFFMPASALANEKQAKYKQKTNHQAGK